MRHSLKASLLILFLATAASWAQERYHADDSNLLARLSYDLSPYHSDGIYRMCIAVYVNGEYRMLSPRETSNGLLELKGTMSKDQLEQLKGLLSARAFRSLSENHGGIIRSDAETFTAELWRQEVIPAFQLQPPGPSASAPSASVPYRRIHWLNADGQSPFPEAMSKVIEWMKNFKASGAQRVESPDRTEACPSVGLSLVQPSVAAR